MYFTFIRHNIQLWAGQCGPGKGSLGSPAGAAAPRDPTPDKRLKMSEMSEWTFIHVALEAFIQNTSKIDHHNATSIGSWDGSKNGSTRNRVGCLQNKRRPVLLGRLWYTYIGSACRAGGSGERRWGWGRGRAARLARWSAGSETERGSARYERALHRFDSPGTERGDYRCPWARNWVTTHLDGPVWVWLSFIFTLRAISRNFYPKRLTVSTFVRRKRNNLSLLVQ